MLKSGMVSLTNAEVSRGLITAVQSDADEVAVSWASDVSSSSVILEDGDICDVLTDEVLDLSCSFGHENLM